MVRSNRIIGFFACSLQCQDCVGPANHSVMRNLTTVDLVDSVAVRGTHGHGRRGTLRIRDAQRTFPLVCPLKTPF